MKTTLGIFIGISLALGATSFAETIDVHGIQLTQIIRSYPVFGWSNAIRKYYDYDDGVVCYTVNQNGISCIKN